MARRKSISHESENTDRWMVSYADFVTLLFAFFVVMYAISSVNEGKYRVLADTMTDALKVAPKSPEPIQIGKESKAVSSSTSRNEIIKPIKPNNDINDKFRTKNLSEIQDIEFNTICALTHQLVHNDTEIIYTDALTITDKQIKEILNEDNRI